jgi:hypothetical protein
MAGYSPLKMMKDPEFWGIFGHLNNKERIGESYGKLT